MPVQQGRMRGQALLRAAAIVLVLGGMAAAWMLWQRSPPPRIGSAAMSGAGNAAPAGQLPWDGRLALIPRPRVSVPPRSLFTPPVSPAADPAPVHAQPAPAPQPATAAAVPPASQAPALPYTLLGRMRDAERWTVLLARGSTQVVAREFDVLDGEWRVEGVDETGMDFSYLPLGTRHRLRFTDNQAATAPGAARSPLVGGIAAGTPGLAAAREVSDSAAASWAASAPGRAASAGSSGESQAPAQPPAFERRVRPSDIPREPWVCEAARVNALVPCRNTWSMSEAERVACRKAADGRYNTCLSTALRAAESEN